MTIFSAAARALLLAPGSIARVAALVAPAPEQRWMLCQSREIRCSYVAEVVDRPQDAQERWMLCQPDDIRLSYVREVLDAAPR